MRHKQYWMQVFNQYKPWIIAASIPLAFLILRSTSKQSNIQQAKQYARYIILTILASVQTRVLSALINKAI
ncbi:hypothetical protein [Legionella impletisoli]|uniref:hypothetical protein n=1 Tax=Legionella impletisoli TaxID=343510 RepID=UPI0010412A45|nr:hypothetical protein [Legionella impletisoli]